MTDNQQNIPSYPQPPIKETTNKKNESKWPFWGLIALLLGVIIYLVFDKQKIAQQLEASEITATTADSSRAVLQQDFDAAIARLDEMASQNASMDSLLNDRDEEVQKLKSEISSILKNSKATKQDLDKAQRLIKELNTKVKNYEEKIALLESENKTLARDNEMLISERNVATTETAELRKVGSILVASNIRLMPIDLKRNGAVEKETVKARKADIMRVIFDIAENRIAESGPYEIFIKIIDPKGEVVSNASYGSGVTTSNEGYSVPYTFSKQIQLEKGKPVQNITAEWKNEGDYAKGNYIIELYNSGVKIGSSAVTLK